MAVTLAPLEKTAYVTFSQPKSNMDWFRYVDSNPAWAKQLGGEVPVGINTVTFTVRSPVSDLTASCNFTIQVVDKEVPRVTNCPSPFTTFLEPGETSQIVTWHEPIFTDNVDVVQLTKSRVRPFDFDSFFVDESSANVPRLRTGTGRIVPVRLS